MATSAFTVEFLHDKPRAQILAAVIDFGEPEQTFQGDLQFVVSGVSHVNALGIAPLTVSAFWTNLLHGASAFTYNWTGSAATLPATTSQVTIVVTGASGTPTRRAFSALITDAQQQSISRQFYITVTQVASPTPFDGHVVTETQRRRRVFPV